jgi:sugar phosphate isomerase/epimerase
MDRRAFVSAAVLAVLAGRGAVTHQQSPSNSGSAGAANNLGLSEPGGINFDTVFRGLHEIGYTGYFTVHSRTSQAKTPIDLATKTFAFLKPYANGTKG